MRLTVLPGTLTVCRLAPDASLADWMQTGVISSVSRTADELSVVCAQSAVPQGVRAEKGWRALRVEGPLAFSLTGVLTALATPLAEAGVSIFAVSTFDTDWILVKDEDLPDAVRALRQSGHAVGDEEGSLG